MEDFKYIAIVRAKDETTVYGFYSKRVMFTVASNLMNFAYAIEIMDMSVYKYSDKYAVLREFKEVIDYKGGRR